MTNESQLDRAARAIAACIREANPDAFHPAYERDEAMWRDAARRAREVFAVAPAKTYADGLRKAIEIIEEKRVAWKNSWASRDVEMAHKIGAGREIKRAIAALIPPSP